VRSVIRPAYVEFSHAVEIAAAIIGFVFADPSACFCVKFIRELAVQHNARAVVFAVAVSFRDARATERVIAVVLPKARLHERSVNKIVSIIGYAR